MTDNPLDVLVLPVDRAAPALLGWRLQSNVDGTRAEVRLNEVEAYGGSDDAASHAYRGSTERNSSMFLSAGTLYVYRSYGVHWCANVVTGPPGDGQAVLLRGGYPTDGVELMVRRRGRGSNLTDGPGKLCQALGIKGEHDGTSLVDGPIRLIPPDQPIVEEPLKTPRIGITKETTRLWRFTLPLGSR